MTNDSPEWMGPPDDLVGGVVGVELVVGRSEKAAIYLTALVAYPTGMSLTADVVTRPGVENSPFEMLAPQRRPADGEPDPGLLRMHLSYADGRHASTLGDATGVSAVTAAQRSTEPPDSQRDLLLIPGGGAGSGNHSHQDYWVWPLPPAGPVTFVCAWPALEVAESSIELDGALIRAAAERAHSVWDD